MLLVWTLWTGSACVVQAQDALEYVNSGFSEFPQNISINTTLIKISSNVLLLFYTSHELLKKTEFLVFCPNRFIPQGRTTNILFNQQTTLDCGNTKQA